ncbi:hypothetical protein QUA97_26930 [Microcoleus sp. CZ3-B2]
MKVKSTFFVMVRTTVERAGYIFSKRGHHWKSKTKMLPIGILT